MKVFHPNMLAHLESVYLRSDSQTLRAAILAPGSRATRCRGIDKSILPESYPDACEKPVGTLWYGQFSAREGLVPGKSEVNIDYIIRLNARC